MLEDILIRTTLACALIIAVSAPMGAMVLWRRMAYFGDAISHAALLGVALAVGFEIAVFWGVLGIALLSGFVLVRLSSERFGTDTALGVIAHGGLAGALVLLSLLPQSRVNLHGLLFGDILAISVIDLAWMAAIFGAILLWLWHIWDRLLMATLSPEIATAEGMRPDQSKLYFTLALTALVAMSIQIIGALLITAFLILPAATARLVAKTPAGMVRLAWLSGALACWVGISVSFRWDTPTGPSIVLAAAILFACLSVGLRLINRRGSQS